MSEYIDADFAVVCDEWRPTVTSGRSKSMSDIAYVALGAVIGLVVSIIVAVMVIEKRQK